ncbi:MAG: hypothetical protein QXW01_03695 [Candidatus Aenigmatarchaeota archaeon]
MRRLLVLLILFLVLTIFLLYYVFGLREKIEIIREEEVNSTIEEIGLNYYSKKLVVRYISRGYNETYLVETFLFQNENEGKKFMDYFLEKVNSTISNKEFIKISEFEGNIATLNYIPGYGLIIRKNNYVIIASGSNKINLIRVVEWITKRY